jgi:hypothetical protein
MNFVLDLLSEFLSDLMSGLFAPSTDRGLVAMNAVGAVGFGLATVVLRLASLSESLHVVTWMFAIVFGVVGVLLSLLHIYRNESDRVFGTCALLASVAGPLFPLAQR